MKKLSKAQERVVGLMQRGWGLGVSHGMLRNAWLQCGGVGRGGQTETVSMSTFMVLRNRGLIYMPDGETFPTDRYQLSTGGPA